MPQLDAFTYFTQFFWSTTLLFSFYIQFSHDGLTGISRLLKLRNPHLAPGAYQLRRHDCFAPPLLVRALADLRTGVATCRSYIASRGSEVDKWAQPSTVFGSLRQNWLLLSCFGELRCSCGMDRHLDCCFRSSYELDGSAGCLSRIADLHVPLGQLMVAQHLDHCLFGH